MNNVKKSIGWADWTLNPIKGLCPMPCEYCYAKRFYQRGCNATFKDKTIRYDPSVFTDLHKAKPGDRIFVGSTIELFHPLTSMWNDEIINHCSLYKDLTFIFLTKCPQNLPKEWPDNCWVGVSTTDFEMYGMAGIYLPDIKAKVKFISYEPLLQRITDKNEQYNSEMMASDLMFAGINWVIIGACTPFSKKTAPKMAWVKEIVGAANKAKIQVFLKNNLHKVFEDDARRQVLDGVVPESVLLIWASNKERYIRHLRQEIPEAK
jgi:protein gp37